MDGEIRNGLGDSCGDRFSLLESLEGSDAERMAMPLRGVGVQITEGGEVVDRSRRMGSAVLNSLDGLTPGPLRIRVRLIGPLERRCEEDLKRELETEDDRSAGI